MLTLCMDTSHKYLSLALIKDHELIASYCELCFKKQSENIFVELEKLFNQTVYKPLDIDSICITKGPGSYTGVRIAMSIAKTMASLRNIPLYTISTLKLYANNRPNTLVLLDARSNRAYNAIYNNNNLVEQDNVKEIALIDTINYYLVGDLSLIDKEDFYPNIPECFLNTKDSWNKEDNVDYITPTYLKDNNDYLI